MTLIGTFKSNRIFLGISSFEMIAMFRRGLFYSYLSVYLRHFIGLSVTETTLFATLPMVLNIVFQTFVWGVISDRTQKRRTMIVYGELLAGIGTVILWYAHTLAGKSYLAGYVIIIGLSVIEIFWSMSNVGWSALISDIYPQRSRHAVQGKLASIGGIGRIAGVWIGGVLYDGLGMKYAGWGFHEGALFFVASAAMFLSILPMRFVPEGGVRRSSADGAEILPDQTIASLKTFYVFIAAMVLINFGRNSIAVIITQYLMVDPGPAVASRTLSHIVNTQSVAMILAGLSAGRLGRMLGDKCTLILGAVVSTVSLIVLAATTDLRWIYLGNFLRGLSDVIIMAASYAVASALIPPEKRARFFGIFNATFFLSWGLAGTFIAGPIVDLLLAYGSSEVFAYHMSFASAALITAIGLFVMLYLLWVDLPRCTSKTPDKDKPGIA